ncbi:MAG: hypothetical protein M0R51_17040, partial [Clostridia bacterium]|nr:hypothetical protein [Clostridia bacterium]
MSNYDELVEFRNKLTNDTDCVIFEEDCQLLDRILDDLEQKDKCITELEEYYLLYEELLENKGTEADNINLKNDIENLKHKNFGWLRIQNLEKEVEQLQAKLEIWNRFNKEDYIHKGEKATERDYYYYTNGASSVLENEVEQLQANQNKIAIEKLEDVKQEIENNGYGGYSNKKFYTIQDKI